MENQIIPVADMQSMAKAVAESRLFTSIDTPQKAMVLMMICQAEGRNAAEAVTRYHIIEGKPSKQAHAILSDFQAAGGTMKYITRTDECVKAEFTHPAGGTVVIDWDMARAKRAGLEARHNWKSYPRQMLTARVISEGVRAVFPSAVGGLYTPEEVQDFDDKKPPVQIPAEVKPEPAPDAPPSQPPVDPAEAFAASKTAIAKCKTRAELNKVAAKISGATIFTDMDKSTLIDLCTARGDEIAEHRAA